MKLLHLDASVLGDHSVTRQLTGAIVARWQAHVPGLEVTHRDLDAAPIPHLAGSVLGGTDDMERARGEATLQQFLEADVVVVGAPMYNFGIPSTLKAWIDRIAVNGRTFRYTANGPEGLARGKRVVVATAAGGVHGGQPTDFVEPYLRQLFGFLGISDIEFVRADGIGLSPEHRAKAIDTALAALPEPLRKAA
ncbi:FMN-dependent NADH-azoreductase [Luteimonas aestuarii]|uniref:FMN dependent NADH:quinone oxidoreductase n=1 Tax=Luteimonas aestuarii TaxID=453837 RepID=A0A4R5U3Q5_9GAMM|nr:NAD(P)H-dependent oxidoreductase [Luteimonas aestuarii]TDK28327.1 FMN-dependent NADH-azoreductase [Luteimonas aestuarii]